MVGWGRCRQVWLQSSGYPGYCCPVGGQGCVIKQLVVETCGVMGLLLAHWQLTCVQG